VYVLNRRREVALTPRQVDALLYVAGCADDPSPTLDELAAGLGVRHGAGAVAFVTGLEDAGLVTRERGRARSIRLTDDGRALARAIEIERAATGAGLTAGAHA
jgi:DNA-binding MarR family transcriptional regulator